MTDGADHPEDRELIRRALNGQADAAEALVARLSCVPRVLSALNQRIGSPLGPEDLRDLSQDVLMALWTRVVDYSGGASLETWAYGFCQNTFMSMLRRRRIRVLEPLEEQQIRESRAADTVAGDYERLYDALERLDQKEERVIRLKYFEGLTFEEIGARLAISPNTVKTWFYRGMQRLEKFLQPSVEGSS